MNHWRLAATERVKDWHHERQLLDTGLNAQIRVPHEGHHPRLHLPHEGRHRVGLRREWRRREARDIVREAVRQKDDHHDRQLETQAKKDAALLGVARVVLGRSHGALDARLHRDDVVHDKAKGDDANQRRDVQRKVKLGSENT